MQSIVKILTGIFATILFFSCEKTIDFDGDIMHTQIVVNGVLTPEMNVSASILKSRSQLSEDDFFESLTNAKADLYVDGVFTETLKYEGRIDTSRVYLPYDVIKETPYNRGIYMGKTTVEAGKTYRLEISSDGLDAVKCETTVPIPVAFAGKDTSRMEVEQDWGTTGLFSVSVGFKDPKNIDNYYRIYSSTLSGSALTYNNGSETVIYPDTILTYYDYPGYVDPSDPIFYESNNEANDIVMGTPNNQFSIFSDGQIRGQEHTLKINFNYTLTNEGNASGRFSTRTIIFYSLSKEYFEYLNTVNYHFWYAEDYFSEPVPVYSNVIGGMGIWGSESYCIYEVTTGEYPMEGKIYIDRHEYYNSNNGYVGGYGSPY